MIVIKHVSIGQGESYKVDTSNCKFQVISGLGAVKIYDANRDLLARLDTVNDSYSCINTGILEIKGVENNNMFVVAWVFI